MSEKMTAMQRRLLEEIAAGDGRSVKSYSSARALADKGFIEWFDDDGYSRRLRLTEAGRAALRSDGGKE